MNTYCLARWRYERNLKNDEENRNGKVNEDKVSYLGYPPPFKKCPEESLKIRQNKPPKNIRVPQRRRVQKISSKYKENWKIGRLENWKIGKLENWKVGKLENTKISGR